MYLRIDEGFLEHPKTKRFCRLVGDRNGAVYLLRLWTWALNCAPNGDITDAEAEDIEDTIRWRGGAGACYDALVSTGFVDERDGRRTIHNWDRWVGADLERMDQVSDARREAARLRKQNQRDRERGDVTPPVTLMSRVTERDCHAPKSVTGVTVTPPDQTSQDQSDQGKARQGQPGHAPDPTDARDPAEHVARTTEPTAMQSVALAVLDLPAPVVPELVDHKAPPTTSHDLKWLFGKVRMDALSQPLNPPSGMANEKKADLFLREYGRDLAAMAEVEPTMRLFFTEARGDPREVEMCHPNHGFGFWLSRFPGLREQLHTGPVVRAHPKDVQLARFLSGEG
jgi:hypothetical protein